MLRWLKHFFRNIIRKSTYVRQEPLNKVSIVVLIMIDIFVLINVFQGVYSISNFPLSPSERYPCYTNYQNYHSNTDQRKDLILVEERLGDYPPKIFEVNKEGRLGKVSNSCDRLKELEAKVKNPATVALENQATTFREKISRLNTDIDTYTKQYDSTLLEKIAGQNPNQSINKTTADKAKADIAKAQAEIKKTNELLQAKETELLQQSDVLAYLKEVGNISTYEEIKKDYESAEFWYPNKQFGLQALFLLPLIILGYFWHTNSVNHRRGTQALLSWHLLLIFCIPLLVKILEFLQFSNLVSIIIDIIVAIFGGIAFLASYVLILIIPLVGFGLIKFLQRFIFNPKIQAKGRIQKSRCIQCNSRLRLGDEFCSFCGFEQFEACSNCQARAYKYTEFCHSCGVNRTVNLSDSLPETS
jgi:hypothetical protein